MSQQAIAIIGMSGLFPEAGNPQQLLQNLREGRDSVRPLSEERLSNCGLDLGRDYKPFAFLDRIDQFDHKYFRISKSEAEMMEPSQRLLLEMAIHAIENAGYRPEDLRGTKTAVYLAARTWAAIQYYLLANEDDNPAVFTGTLSPMIYGRIANFLDLHGPTMMIDAACASSLIAISEACGKLISEEVDYALAGGLGININLSETGDKGHLGTQSSHGRCRAFDAEADGIVDGEGGGLLLLKRLSDAVRDRDHIHAVIRGSATCHNGNRSNGIMAPSPEAQAETITTAWRNAGIDPETVGFIEVHGTGTRLGDPIEFRGITDAFNEFTSKKGFCAISTVKSNMGHLGSGAGVAGLIKAVLSLREKQLFPSLHFERPNPFIDFEGSAAYVNTQLKDWSVKGHPRRCGVSAFGLSGTNAHIVLEEWAQEAPAPPIAGGLLLKVSARTPEALRQYANTIHSFLKGCSGDWTNQLYTLNRGRSDLAYRTCFYADSKEELLEQLAGVGALDEVPGRELVLLLGDGGFDAQYQRCRQLEALGLRFAVVIGTGTGRYVSKVLMGELPVEAAKALMAKEAGSNRPFEATKFKAVIQKINTEKSPVFLEIGSDHTMSGLLEEWQDELGHAGCLVTSRHLLPVLAALYNRGVPVDWTIHYGSSVIERTECPVYPFERTRCWFREPTGSGTEEQPELGFDAWMAANASSFTPTEVLVAGIWQQLLKLDTIKPADDFYDLGGDSLSVIRLINKIEQAAGIRLSVNDTMNNSTLAGIAACIDSLSGMGTRPTGIPLLPAGLADFELSHAQLRFWLLDRAEAGREAYNVPNAYRLKGRVDSARLEKALQQLIDRHESLRTSFVLKQGVPRQKILTSTEMDFRLRQEDHRALAPEESAARIKAAAGAAFDLSKGGLIRTYLYQVEDDGYVFLLVLHHIACDGRSMEIIRDSILHSYEGGSAAPLRIQYKDYAAWQNERIRSGYFDKHREYWRQRLDGCRPVALDRFFDFPRQAKEDFDAGYQVCFLPEEEMKQWKAVGANSTLFINTLVVFNILLAEYTGQTDLLIGTPVGGREHTDLEDQVGVYLNTLLLRTGVNADLPFLQLLEDTRSRVVMDYSFQNYPFDILVNELGFPGNKPLFNVGYTWNTRLVAGDEQSLGFGIEEFPTGFNMAKADLWLHVTETADGLQLGLLYKKSLFREDTIGLFSGRLLSLIRQCTRNPSMVVGALNLDIAPERAEKTSVAFDFSF